MNRTVRRSALLLSVVGAVIGGLAVAGISWWVLWHLLGARAETPNQVDLSKIALAVTAVVGGAVLLVVVYRRQRDLERGRFAELFGAAARQLGDPDPAVRIAGVYALAGVADEFVMPVRRQQCVDVLCGYLRLPYVPDEGSSHLVSKAQRVKDSGTSVERVYAYRNNDRQVRHTIVRVIADRLRPTAETPWSACDFDFSEVVFEDADFARTVFSGRETRFCDAIFVGDRTSFAHARFIGERITFRRAIFREGGRFDHAVFAPVGPAGTGPEAAGVTFADTVFAGPTSFESAQFGGPRTEFVRTTFGGDRTTFASARFASAVTSFERALFDGGRVAFTAATFTGASVAFTATRFYADACVFDCAQLGGNSRWRGGRTREITFARAEYQGKVSFVDAVFGGRSVIFTGGDFFGEIDFQRAAFDARAITFDKPKAWIGVQVDWDASPVTKPANISPAHWPPVPAGATPEPAS